MGFGGNLESHSLPNLYKRKLYAEMRAQENLRVLWVSSEFEVTSALILPRVDIILDLEKPLLFKKTRAFFDVRNQKTIRQLCPHLLLRLSVNISKECYRIFTYFSITFKFPLAGFRTHRIDSEVFSRKSMSVLVDHILIFLYGGYTQLLVHL